MSVEYTVQNLTELTDVAHKVVATLQGGETLLLSGDLGAGKTTFTQLVARELGIKEAITSPTFTIAGEYKVPQHAEIKHLLHLDLYRLPDAGTSIDPVISELLAQAGQPNTLMVIEWPEKLGSHLPKTARWIYFRHGDKAGERVVRVE